jgi:hypothetical protein
LSRSFEIPMKDQKINFEDIIDLSEDQVDLIVKAAPGRSMSEWITLEKGCVKIPLEKWQQKTVLAHKGMLVENKDEAKLLKDETVIFTKHAKSRVALRVEKVDRNRPPKPESLLLIIKLVIESEVVDDEAEWKGHTNLVYTLIHEGYGERFKISVTFEKVDDEHMKVITVSNEHIDELTEKIGNLPEIRKGLEELKKRLVLEAKE